MSGERRRPARVPWAALAGLLPLAVAGVATAGAAPPCEAVAFSPSFGSDRVMFCGWSANDRTQARLAVSADAGRHWGTAATVATRNEPISVVDIVVSPLFATTPTVVVATTGGVFASDDGGRSFRVVIDDFDFYRLTPYVDTAPAGGDAVRRLAVAMVGPAVLGAHVYDALTGDRSVVGAPMFNSLFLVPDDYPSSRVATAIGVDIGASVEGEPVHAGGVYAYSCAADFACPTSTFYFGRGIPPNAGTVPAGRFSYLHVSDPAPGGNKTVWRTDDAGRNWRRWRSVESALRAVPVTSPNFTITASADAPRRLFLLAVAAQATSRAAPAPAYQLFRSDDDGASWRRIAHAWGRDQRARSRSTLPWNGDGASHAAHFGYVSAQPGGRLYAVGAVETATGKVIRQGLYCSRDLGRTWTSTC